MKTLSLLKRITLAFLLSVSITHLNANTMSNDATNNVTQESSQVPPSNQQEATDNQSAQREAIEKLKKLILKVITEIDFTLETLATYVFSDEVTTTDKDQVLDNIKELRRGVSTVARDVMMYADMAILSRTLKFLDSVQTHIKSAVNNGLSTFPQFEVETLQLRSMTELSAEEIEEKVLGLKKELEAIKKDAESVGISWYNTLYRNTVDRFLIEPIDKYKLHKKLGWAALLGTSTVYFWYRFSQDPAGCTDEYGNPLIEVNRYATPIYHDQFGNPIPEALLKEYDGEKFIKSVEIPDYNATGVRSWLRNRYLEANGLMRKVFGRTIYDTFKKEECYPTFYYGINPGKLARVDDFLNAFNTGAVAVGAYLFWPRLQAFYEDHIAPGTGWLQRQAVNFHCWSKGGIYYKHNKNKSHRPFRINPRFRFKDIIGGNEAKLVGRQIIEFINDPEKFQRQAVVPPKGILLYGPPGTGKSYWAEALCGEVMDALKENNRDEKEFGFFIIKSTHIQQMGLDNILQLMKKWAPCIVFIDEIDLLSLQRDRNPERLAEFLSGLSGFLSEADPKKQVIVIGATNKVENVDRAVTRAGRLHKLIYLDYPSYQDRYEFLIRTLDDRINPDLFDLEKIARQTSGCTIEDLRFTINNALFKTRVFGQPLTQKDIEESLNSEVRKIVTHQELDLSQEEQRILAIHMAGHAVAHMHLPTSRLLSVITIKPVTERMREESVWHQYCKEQDPGQIFGKIFTHCPYDSLATSNTQILLNECRILLAGRLAEQILLGSISSNNKRTCNGTCKPSAFSLAKQILLNGCDEDQYSKQMKEDLIVKAHNLLNELENEVKELLEQQKPLVMFIADALIEQKTITYEEIMFTLQQAYEQAAKENPELIEELERQMKEQSETLAAKRAENENLVQQEVSKELDAQEGTTAAQSS